MNSFVFGNGIFRLKMPHEKFSKIQLRSQSEGVQLLLTLSNKLLKLFKTVTSFNELHDSFPIGMKRGAFWSLSTLKKQSMRSLKVLYPRDTIVVRFTEEWYARVHVSSDLSFLSPYSSSLFYSNRNKVKLKWTNIRVYVLFDCCCFDALLIYFTHVL
jgi:hypothetical protein